LIKHVKAGNRIEIALKNSAREKLHTVIEAVLQANQWVVVKMPLVSGNMIKLPFKKEYELRIFTSTNILTFDATVVNHVCLDGNYLTVLKLENDGAKVQHRDHFRLNSGLEFEFSLATDRLESDPNSEIATYKAATMDLSASGMRFTTNKELSDGDKIYANFILNSEYIIVLGKIISGGSSEDPNFEKEYRCKFVAVPDNKQQKIIQFLNSQQKNA